MNIAFVGDFDSQDFWQSDLFTSTKPALNTYPTTKNCTVFFSDGFGAINIILSETGNPDGTSGALASVSPGEALGVFGSSLIARIYTRNGYYDVSINESNVLMARSSSSQKVCVLGINGLTPQSFQNPDTLGIEVRNGAGNASNLIKIFVYPVTTSDSGYQVVNTHTIYSSITTDVATRWNVNDYNLIFATMAGGVLPPGVSYYYDGNGYLHFNGIPTQQGTYTSFWLGPTLPINPSQVVYQPVPPFVQTIWTGGDGDQWTDSNSSEEEGEGYDWSGTAPQKGSPSWWPTNSGGMGEDPWDGDGDPQDPNDQSGGEGGGIGQSVAIGNPPQVITKIVFSISNIAERYSFGSTIVALSKYPNATAKPMDCSDWPTGYYIKVDEIGVVHVYNSGGSVVAGFEMPECALKSTEWQISGAGNLNSVLLTNGRPVCGTMITESAERAGYIQIPSGIPPFKWVMPYADGLATKRVVQCSCEITDDKKHSFFSNLALSTKQGTIRVDFYTDDDYGNRVTGAKESKLYLLSCNTLGRVSEIMDYLNSGDYSSIEVGENELSGSGTITKKWGTFRMMAVVFTPEGARDTTWHCDITFSEDPPSLLV